MRIGSISLFLMAGLGLAGMALAAAQDEPGTATEPPAPAPEVGLQPAAEPAAPGAEPAAVPTADQARRDKLLVQVGERRLTVGDFEEQLSSDEIPPPVRASYADPARVQQEFESRVDRMVIAEWARRQGLDRRADIRCDIRRLFRGATIYHEVHDPVDEASISDADVAAYYQQHSDLYNRPETVNGGLILLADRNAAETALQRALAVKGNRAELTKIVRELSVDDETKRRGGSLGYFDRDGKLNRVVGAGQAEPPRVDAAVVAAAFSLSSPFDVYAQVVDTARGPAVVFILNRTPAVSRSLDEVAQRIRLELVNQRRDQARERYGIEARARYNVQVVDANFEHVVVAPTPPELAGGPPADMMGDPHGMVGPMRPPMPRLPPLGGP